MSWNLLCRRLGLVDLLEKVLDITLNTHVIHRSQDRLHRFCFCELIKLLAAMYTSQLENQRET